VLESLEYREKRTKHKQRRVELWVLSGHGETLEYQPAAMFNSWWKQNQGVSRDYGELIDSSHAVCRQGAWGWICVCRVQSEKSYSTANQRRGFVSRADRVIINNSLQSDYCVAAHGVLAYEHTINTKTLYFWVPKLFWFASFIWHHSRRSISLEYCINGFLTF